MVTSPTYYGINLNIASLAAAAHSAKAMLIVDSSHGSHLRACGMDDGLALGADAVIFSAHKTLSALGQGALLLLRESDEGFARHVRELTAFFGTTSPSYPIMASLDLSRLELEAQPGAYRKAAEICANTADFIRKNTPFVIISPQSGTDPCRLSVNTAAGGIDGFAAAQALRGLGIEPEMADGQNVVLIFTPRDSEQAAGAVARAFASIGKDAAPTPLPAVQRMPRPKSVMPPRKAFFACKKLLPLACAAGEVAAQNLAPYPPGVPAVIIGEQIDNFAVEYLMQKGYNGKSNIFVTAQTDI